MTDSKGFTERERAPEVGTPSTPRGDTRVALVAVGVAALLGVARSAAVFAAAGGAERLPQWDPAKYGLDGLRLAQAFAAFDLVEVATRLHALAVWPPVFPLLEAIAFGVLGPGYRTPEVAVAVLFAALVAATAAAGVAAAAGRASLGDAAAGVLAATLLAASPLVQVHANLAMLEVPGAFFSILAFAAWARADATGRPADFRLAAVAATVLFFTKTNYGVLWLAPLGLFAASRAAGGPVALARGVLAAVRRIAWRRPWPGFLAVALLGLATLAVTIRLGGPLDVEVAGLRLRAGSLGNPLYALYLLAVLRAALRPRRTAAAARRLWDRLPDGGRVFALWTALPIGVWLLLPPHLAEVVGFFENRDSGIPLLSLGGLLFYPRVFVDRYAPHPALGVAALALVAVSAFAWRRLPPARRLLLLGVAVGLGAATLHGYKLDRFLLTVTPFVWLAAALAAVDLVRAGLGRAGVGGRTAGGVAAALAVLAAVSVHGLGIDAELLRRERELRTVDPAARPVLNALADAAKEGPLVVLGTWNGLSPALVEWHLRARTGRPTYPPGTRRELARKETTEAIEAALLRSPAGTRVALLEATEPAAWTAAFEAETAWLDPLRRRLARRRGAAQLDLALEAEVAPPGSGYRLRVFRRVGGAGAEPAPASAASTASWRSSRSRISST